MSLNQLLRSHLVRGTREAHTLARASLSSAIATFVDGTAYQLLLLGLGASYGVAAFVGALIGGITNFGINRRWTFATTRKRMRTQASEYAIASLSTYLALQTGLFLLVEVGHIDEHVAWMPAKAAAWLLVSYPMHRLFVFSERTLRPAPSTGSRDGQPEHSKPTDSEDYFKSLEPTTTR